MPVIMIACEKSSAQVVGVGDSMLALDFMGQCAGGGRLGRPGR
jgi:hypothetical protein